MQIGQYNYNRVSQKMPCPVCKRTHWCLISDNGLWFICTKVESSKSYEAYYGWLHPLGNTEYLAPKKVIKTKDYKHDPTYVRMVYDTLNFDSCWFYRLAEKLNLPPVVFTNLGVGTRTNVFYFPMFNAQLKLIGLKIRNLDGKKWCLEHSQLGIYVSRSIVVSKELYICEGESDTAALLSHNYNVVGRASATSCKGILKEFTKQFPKVTIVSDYDIHGLGFKESCKLARFINRPVSIVLNREYKDIRKWINSGTFTHEKFEKLKKEFI